MSSRYAERFLPSRLRRWRPLPLSITARLALLYTASTFLLLSAICAYLYVTLDNYLHRKDSLAVRDQVILLRHMLVEVRDPSVPLSKARKWEERGVDNKRFQSRIVDDDYSVLAESPHMVPGATDFPPPVHSPNDSFASAQWTAPNGSRYVLMAAWGKSGRAPEQQKVIQVALERSASMALLEDFREMLLAALAVALTLTAALALLVARQGMAPLREITAAAYNISASQLHERLGQRTWPRELKELSAAFDDMLQRLEESFRRLSQFSSDLAHELRTPIANLTGEAQVAISRSRSADEYRTVLESSLEEYERLTRMMDSLLFLARAETSEALVKPATLDVAAELSRIVEFYEVLAEERGVRIICEDVVPITADPTLFQRAVSNLVSNALRYTAPGGIVRIRAAQASDGFVELAVSDSGVGIEPEHLPRIFDRFYRADAARSCAEGAGLGLAIVKSIVELHGGSVSAESVAGHGTTISLRFPSPRRNARAGVAESTLPSSAPQPSIVRYTETSTV